MVAVPNIRNYVGGSLEDPCPTGGVFAWALGNCRGEDLDSWKLSARDMWRDAIEPTWDAYAEAKQAQDPGWDREGDRLWEQIEVWRASLNRMPDMSSFSTGRERTWAVSSVVSLMVFGDNLVSRLQAQISELGREPPDVPDVPDIDFGKLADLPVPADPTDSGPPRWLFVLLGALGVAGVAGATGYVVGRPKRRGK